MSDFFKDDRNTDDFWNLDEYAKKNMLKKSPTYKQFSRESTSSVEIEIKAPQDKPDSISTSYADSSLSHNDNGTITRFIPPRKDSVFDKKYAIFEYSPENPLIKSVKVYSDKPDDSVFIQDNLFIRERRAYLNKTVEEQPYTSYYSYSPRYSNMSKAQLKWYLWWRQNARNGVFLKADESYIVLYTYELAATEEREDKLAALDMMCALLRAYGEKDINIVVRMMIRDIICDFCLIHALPSPIDKLGGLDKKLLSSAPLPELFVDLSENNKMKSADFICSNLSLYDYKRSKVYNDSNSELFNNAINQALMKVIGNDQAFHAITSFTEGVYGCITVERRPFTRMVNIVNRNVKMEIIYYQLNNIQNAITDAVRYSENKLREHLGIKSRLHILSVNPHVQRVLDDFFAENYPSAPVYDRRRRSHTDNPDTNEYDKLYDVPKAEISPERALEIEKESWNTTKILTEAFNTTSDDISTEFEAITVTTEPATDRAVIDDPIDVVESTDANISNTSDLFTQLQNQLGKSADLLQLCITGSLVEQRRFALSQGLGLDELADRINETAVEIFGDIILENDGSAYRIIDDYRYMFNF